MSPFERELFRNGETGVPQAFDRADGQATTEEDYLALRQSLAEEEIEVSMGAFSASALGRQAIIKTAEALSPEILEIVRQRTQLKLAHEKPPIYH